MAKVRHWKQKWDPEAPLVFRKRLLLNGVQVGPGTVVTKEIRSALGEDEFSQQRRLKLWWDSGYLEIQNWGLDVKPAEETPQIVEGKRGWFKVTLADGSTKNVRGRQVAEALLASQPIGKPVTPVASILPEPEVSEEE
tara:strand:- start:11840 stop:12253 length:414 start_codon:yes stop_codon:yes gene_type:complete